jgi:hypothetical protein
MVAKAGAIKARDIGAIAQFDAATTLKWLSSSPK